MQGFADDVFEGAYNITADAQSGLGIFDDLTIILNVDLNVTGMNRDVQVSIGTVHWHMHVHMAPHLLLYPQRTMVA